MKWKEYANQIFLTPKELLAYRKYITENELWAKQEQDWVDEYLQPLMDLLGETSIWKYIAGEFIELYGIETGEPRKSQRNIPTSNKAQAYFRHNGTTGHWYSRKRNEKEWFDSYQEYQIVGTNQFCQTFALMNLVDKLPKVEKTKQNSMLKYYNYTYEALLFIQHVIETTIYSKRRKIYMKKITECLSHPNICVNAIHVEYVNFLLESVGT